MEARELRIGNYIELFTPCNPVRLRSGIYRKVFSIDYTGIKVVDPNILPAQQVPVFLKWYEFVEIPLTEQWLKDFGFEKNKKHFVCDNIWIELDFNSPAYPFYNIFIKQRNSDGVLEVVLLDIELRYVHQLQNLYFALTGEELEIK